MRIGGCGTRSALWEIYAVRRLGVVELGSLPCCGVGWGFGWDCWGLS